MAAFLGDDSDVDTDFIIGNWYEGVDRLLINDGNARA
jgi:hypothetical protein